MNTEMKAMLLQAEGRYLSEGEMSALRTYASGMGARIDAVRRIRDSEDTMMARALARIDAELGASLAQRPGARDAFARDLRLVVRAASSGLLRDDLAYFRESFAEWMSEVLCSLSPPSQVKAAQAHLRAAMQETLEPVDERALRPFFDAFASELDKWS